MKNKKIAIIGLTGESIFMEVENFHKKGETIQAKSLNIEPGGKGYNQAVACARFNMDVSYLTAVGNDNYGLLCEEFMKKEGIKTFFSKKEEKTAFATILTNQYGDNQVSVYKGASEKLNLSDLEAFKEEIKSSDILLVQNEIPYDVLKESVKYAHDNNVYVILNPAPAIYNINELLPYINVLIPNEVEYMQIYDESLEKIIIENNLKLIITLGEKGCLYIDKNNRKNYEGRKVEVVDTTGAGDVFCAAVASQILINNNIDEVIDFANLASSLHIKKKYVMDAIPKLSDIIK